jgi:phenylacetate-CoA ligase
VNGQAVYDRLPVPLQHLAISAAGWRIQRTRFNAAFDRLLRELEERGRWDDERIAAYRDRRIGDVVAHAVRTVPYYRRLFAELSAAPEDVRSLDDLSRLPVLTKDDVRTAGDDLLSEDVPATARVILHTSGTTGAGLQFASTTPAVREQWAVWWRYWGWHGIRPGTWCALFAGHPIVPTERDRPPFSRVNRPRRQLMFSGYHMSPDNLPHYVEELRHRRPPWLHGYPSLLALLASHVVETGSELGFPVRWVTTGAENLLPHQIDLIERAFGVPPRQHYGNAEAAANLSQCEQGRLHVDEDFAAVEFVRDDPSAPSRLIGTNLSNPAMPLLRYEMGDVAVLFDGECGCGRPGRVVERVDGRLEDYVIRRNGARVGRLDHLFKDMVHVREAQIRQSRPGEMTIRLVRVPGYGEADENQLLHEVRMRLGEDMEVAFEYVDSIERSSTGKLRLVVSDVHEGAIERVESGAVDRRT